MLRKFGRKTWWVWIILAIMMVAVFVLLGNAKTLKGVSKVDPTVAPTSTPTADPNLPTIEDIAAIVGCKVGNLEATYRADTEFTHEDGTFIEVDIQRITTHKVYGANNGETVFNVVVIENGVSTPESRTFVRHIGTFACYDAHGNELHQGDLYTQTGKKFTEIIIEVEKLDECKYLKIGGLEFDELLFPVSPYVPDEDEKEE